jgi:SAM-dependent methyltransferase
MSLGWVESFFDAEYLKVWGAVAPPQRTEREVEGIWQLANLAAGSRVLDAPCGYGRISHVLASRGADVLGVDQSAALLADAATRPLPTLRYLRHDLREPLAESGFDAALNIFSSLGYSTEADDLAILTNLARAVRPGGTVIVESNHRDNIVARLSKGCPIAFRLPDLMMIEEPKFDPATGRVDTTWHWSGPIGSGSKSASFRVYAITEIVSLVERAGLTVRGVHRGLTTEPYGSDLTGRVAVVATR